jgi:hypothetical protein
MKLLFIGNANSFLLIRLAEQLMKSTPNLTIDIVTLEGKITKEAKDVFQTIYFEPEKRFGEDIRLAKVLFLANKLGGILKKTPIGYDSVCLLYLSVIYRLKWSQIKKKSFNQVITLFGSEFYRSGKVVRFLQKKMLREATTITYANELLWNDVSEYFELDKSKGKQCLFGLSILDEIDRVTSDEDLGFRTKYQLKESQLIVACGTNSSSNQALEEIITAVVPVKEKLNDVVLFFQFPDLAISKYAKQIIDQVKSSGINFVVLDDYLSDHELAIYRKAAFALIQVQNTDQLSGAMQEHLYAGSKVITGDWLPYAIFDEIGIEYSKVKDRKEIGPLLIELLAKSNQENENCAKIGKLSKWSSVIGQWKNIFYLK